MQKDAAEPKEPKHIKKDMQEAAEYWQKLLLGSGADNAFFQLQVCFQQAAITVECGDILASCVR